MNAHNEERIKQLLKDALLPIGDAEPERDLWPSMLRRLDAPPLAVPLAVPWYDWALAAGLAVFAAAFPAAIPVFLYYL